MRSQINVVDSSATVVDPTQTEPEWSYEFAEETMIIDERASQRPAQVVEDKLSRVLATSADLRKPRALVTARMEVK